MQNNSKINTVLLIILILLVGFGIWKLSLNMQKETVVGNQKLNHEISFKEYKNDKFSFLYNTNASLIEEDKSGNFSSLRVNLIGEKNKEKGVVVQFFDHI